MCQICVKYISIESVLIFRKRISLVVFFLITILTIFYIFFKNKDYLIRLRIFLTFSEIITNFLNPLNIYKLRIVVRLQHFYKW